MKRNIQPYGAVQSTAYVKFFIFMLSLIVIAAMVIAIYGVLNPNIHKGDPPLNKEEKSESTFTEKGVSGASSQVIEEAADLVIYYTPYVS